MLNYSIFAMFLITYRQILTSNAHKQNHVNQFLIKIQQ